MIDRATRIRLLLAILLWGVRTLNATLVGYWPLDGDAADATGDHHGEFSGSEAYTTGMFNQAATFNRNGCVQLGTDVLPQRAYTKSVWFHKGAFATNHILCGSTRFHGHVLWVPFDNSNYGPVAGHNDDFWALRTAGFEAVVFNQTWYHVAVTYDFDSDGSLRLYLDGREIASRTKVPAPIDRSLVAAGYGTVGTMVGAIDDIAIWDRALSPSEILQIYQSGMAGHPLPLAGVIEPTTGITLTAMPADLQLYPRDPGSNTASVVVAGEAAASVGIERVALRVYRNGAPYAFQTQSVHTVSSATPFSFTVAIEAEVANYTFDLWSGSGSTEALIRRSENVVAGDVLAISGQSNAESYRHYDTSHENIDRFVRTFGYGSDQPQEAFSFRAWGIAFGDGRVIRDTPGSIGQLGLRLGRELVRKLRVPVAILNGANGGAAIGFFQRNDNDPTDMTTNYGRLLYRAQLGGLREHVRAIVWYQGESDGSDTVAHETGFLSLYDDWQSDYPALERVYLHQLRAIETFNNLGIRNVQRNLGDSLEGVTAVSTTGLDGHDGLHFYYKQGAREMADHLVPMIARDLHGAPNDPNVNPPDLLYSFFSDGDRKEITVVTRSPRDTLICDEGANTDFYVNTARLRATRIHGHGNRIVLEFKSPCDPVETLWYLGHERSGPWVTNELGVGLLAFIDNSVLLSTNAPSAPTGVHTLTTLDLGAWVVWNESTNATHYSIRRDRDPVATVHAPSYHDTSVHPLSNYTYAVTAVNIWGTSTVSHVSLTMPARPQPPPSPDGLHCYARGPHAADIWWTPLTNATQYTVTRDGTRLATCEEALFLDAPLEAAATHTYTISATNPSGESPPSAPLTVTTRVASVYANMPSATNYAIVCAADLPDRGQSPDKPLSYLVNRASTITNYFDRVGYYLELTDGLSTQWVFTSMDAFTPYVEELLLPNPSDNDVAFSQAVSNLQVSASVGLNITTGAFRRSGRVEIWSGGYAPVNSDLATNASDTAFDWGDERNTDLAYGSFQIHNCDLDGNGTGTNGQAVLAYSGWEGDGICDVGIGAPGEPDTPPDWTTANNAWDTVRRRLYVLVRATDPPAPPPPPTNITVDAVSYYTVDLSWSPSEGATGYTVRIEGALTATARPPVLRLHGLLPGNTYTGTLVAANHGGLSDATPFIVSTTTPSIFERVPEASEYVPVYVLDIETDANYQADDEIPYALQPAPGDDWTYDRVAYYLELETETMTNWAFASFETILPAVHDLALLSPAACGVIQQYVTNLHVLGSASAGLAHGEFADCGIIEFWPYAYLPANGRGFTNASPHVDDHGDTAYVHKRYGCLQIHIGDTDVDGPGVQGQTILAYNGWAGEDGDDVGVGSAPGQNKDWTLYRNAAAYSVKRLLMLVRPANHATRDSDGDSVPDWWERRYLHHLGVLWTADADADGYSNMAEYIAGTDPRNAFSVPHVTIEPDTQGFGLGYDGLSGRVYAVDYRQTLTSAWQFLSSKQVRTNAPLRLNDTNNVGRMRFYRLRIRMQE